MDHNVLNLWIRRSRWSESDDMIRALLRFRPKACDSLAQPIGLGEGFRAIPTPQRGVISSYRIDRGPSGRFAHVDPFPQGVALG